MDTVRPLLKWIAAHDPYSRVVLTADPAPLKMGRRGLQVITSIAGADIGLPAQLLAVGVERVEVVASSAADARRMEYWQRLTPGLVVPYEPRRHLRSGTVVELGSMALPRRAMFGFVDRSPLDLAADSHERTYTALELLAAAGRIPDPSAVAADAFAVSDGLDPAIQTPASAQNSAVSAPAASAERAEGAVASGVGATLGAADAQPTSASTAEGEAVAGRTLTAQGCIACGVCAAACPSHALVLTPGTITTLTHVARACRGCADCVAACPVDALTQGTPFTLQQVLAEHAERIAEVPTRECEECGSRHPGTGPLCGHCQWKREATPVPGFIPPSVAAKLPQDVLAKLASTPRL